MIFGLGLRGRYGRIIWTEYSEEIREKVKSILLFQMRKYKYLFSIDDEK